jgi:hypothetical protein
VSEESPPRPADKPSRWQTLVYAAILLGILALGAWTKWRVLPTMGTHIDDLVVAVTILDTRTESADELRRRLGSGAVSRVLRWVDARGYLWTAASVGPFFSVPASTTYAPAQFVLTAALLRGPAEYRTILVKGRLPSFLAGAFAAALAALVGFRLGGPAAPARAIALAALVAFSWELVIFSAQMESYAIGVVGVFLMLSMLLRDPERPSRDRYLPEALVLVLMPLIQYQMIFLLPGYVLVRWWQVWRGRRRASDVVRMSVAVVAPAAVSTAAVFVFFLHHYSNAGVGWNAGPGREFLFDVPAHAPAGDVLAYAVRFFAANAVISLAAMTSFLPEAHRAYWPAAAVILGLAAAGAASLAWRRDARARAVLGFVAVAAAVWIVLIVTGKLTLSPTRHSLVLLPIVAVFTAEGACALGVVFGRPAACAVALAASVVFGFSATYSAEVERLRDPFDEAEMRAAIRDSGAEVVVSHSCTGNLRLVRDLGAPLFDWGCGARRWEGAMLSAQPDRILFVSTRSPLSRDIFEQIRGHVGALGGVAPLLERFESYDETVLKALEGPTHEFSSRTVNGGISLHMSLLQRRD